MPPQIGTRISDILTGGADEDDLDGAEGDDVLDGGDGDDFLRGGIGNNTLKGGSGVDAALYATATGPVAVNLALGTAAGSAFSDALAGIEYLRVFGQFEGVSVEGEEGSGEEQ